MEHSSLRGLFVCMVQLSLHYGAVILLPIRDNMPVSATMLPVVSKGLKNFSGKKLSVTRYTLGLLITTGLGLAVAISHGFTAELSEKYFNAADEVFTSEETRWLVSFTNPEVSSTV
jgi:hypothetical protein